MVISNKYIDITRRERAVGGVMDPMTHLFGLDIGRVWVGSYVNWILDQCF